MAGKGKQGEPECVLYLTDVYDGKVNACKRITQLSETMLRRIEDGYKDWHFDYGYANKPCRFIESFCMMPSGKIGVPFRLEPFQKAMIQLMFGFVDDNCMRQFHEALWVQGRKNGKALSLDTQIPTPDGYKLMKDVHVGDAVYGTDGKPVRVTAESEIFHKKMYAVTFEDGEIVKASADHIWTVRNRKAREKAASCNGMQKTYLGHAISDNMTVDLTTEELARRVFSKRHDDKGREYSWRVQMSKPVEKSKKDLPLDPYVLGVWLGNGSSSDCIIWEGQQDVAEMTDLLKDFSPRAKRPDGQSAYRIRIGEKYRDPMGVAHNSVKEKLKEICVLGNKHIPRIYLEGSIEQRLALLQGLMDTDGSVSKRGQCTFSQKDHRFLEEMTELLSGLGIKSTYREKVVMHNGAECHAYEIQFFTDMSMPCFRLERKRMRLKERLAPRMMFKSIVSIDEIPEEPSKCIAVDSKDHLFLCGTHYTPTHNTSLSAALELYMLMADGEGAPQIYNAATSRPQASLAYGAVSKMVRQSKLLQKRLRKGKVVERDEDGIINDANMGFITTLSSQTRRLDGLDVHFAVFDELAACTNRDQYDLVKQGMSARDQPMMLCITTNGFERGNIFDDRYDYGCGILDGTVKDDRFLPIVYELDRREEWTDESAWVKANPGLGPIKKVSTLRDFVSEAEQNPNFLPTVLTKDFNVPENRAAAWLTFDEAVCEDTFDISGMGFRYGIAGFDASDTTDLSSATMMMMRPDDPRIYELKMSWLPEDSLRDDGLRTERDDAPYRQWVKRGLLRLVPGNKVPKQVFIDWLEEVKETYDVWCFAVGYDPWHVIGSDETNLQQYVGKDRADVVRQGVKTLSDPMKQIRADFAANRMVDNHNPLAEWARMNVSVKTDVNANIQPVKLGGKAKNRIDPFMSELFAYVTLLRHYDEYMNVI